MKLFKRLCCMMTILPLFLSGCSKPTYSIDMDSCTYEVTLNQHAYARGDTLTAQVKLVCTEDLKGTITSPDSIRSHAIKAYILRNGKQIAHCSYGDEPCDGIEIKFSLHSGDKLETAITWMLTDDYNFYADDELVLVLHIGDSPIEVPINLTGYSKRKTVILKQDDILTEFHLHFDGCEGIYTHYDIVPCGENSWQLTYEVSHGGDDLNKEVLADCIVTDATVRKVSEVLADYDAGDWDLYNETNEIMVDGSGFSLNVTYPEFSICARGWGKSPPGLYDLAEEIEAIFEQFTDQPLES